MRKVFAVVLLAAPALLADVSGKWAGSAATSNGDQPIYCELKQDGAALTGRIGSSPQEQFPIDNGKVEEGKITFQVKTPSGRVFVIEMKQEGEELTGAASRQEGGQSAKLKLKRAD
ncbi:MAG: hypothetical protein HYZ57_17825 [Acidobacteria bacterium]|nr:hypothetical protein [Acidobacteriota bacterium]